MRADVRDPDGNCMAGDEERGDQPCGSTSSDSNSNGDVKSPKASVTLKNHAVKTLPLKSANGSAKTCKYATKKLKTSFRQKTMLEPVKSKRKAGGEDSIEKAVHIVTNDEESESDDEYVPGPSTSNDIDFGYYPSKVVPWATKNYYPLSIDGLHEEIVDCWQWIRPTRLETATRYKVFEKVREKIVNMWAPLPVKVSVFGSLRTRLFLPSSDIDILVECLEWTQYTDVQLNTNVMQPTMHYLKDHFDIVSFHPAAFVPILKFSDRGTRLNIDISFNTVQGVKAATYMQQVKTEFPCVEPLLLLLKQYIFQNKMHEAYSGGLSSYGISLMLVNFFTIHCSHLRGVQPEHDGVNLGYLLMRFLEVYGHELNYSEVAIDPSTNRYRRRSECVRPTATTGAAAADAKLAAAIEAEYETTEDERQANAAAAASAAADKAAAAEVEGLMTPPVLLSVHDPLHEGNEVCRASFNIYAVRTLFQSALVQLRAVFVADRPGSIVWRKHVYKGTMLGRLLHFSPGQINFRYWLKGFVLSRPEPDQSSGNGKGVASSGVSTLIYGSILSEPSDLSCLLRIPKGGQRFLEIRRPNEVEEKKDEKKKDETAGKNDDEVKSQEGESRLKEDQHEQQPSPLPKQQPNDQWMTVGRGGKVYSGGGGQQSYQREYRYGVGHHKNINYYGNSSLQRVQQGQQPHHQTRPYNGGYQSKTWERMGGGGSKRVFGDRKQSRSTEVLAEPALPPRVLTSQPNAAAAAAAGTPFDAALTTATTTLSYKRSDSAVSSCSTTVMGTASSFSTASSSVSSPTINGHHAASSTAPPPGFGNGMRGSALSSSSPSPSPSSMGSSSVLSRHRGDRMSGRGEVYKPPAARKAAQAAAAAGTTGAAGCAAGSKKRQEQPNGVIPRPMETTKPSDAQVETIPSK
ncbi:gld-4 [Pristionchus pacificus]|nr:gld-4 [Pristionchus pacificus]